jgi:RND family efflux transporter MFP subunit
MSSSPDDTAPLEPTADPVGAHPADAVFGAAGPGATGPGATGPAATGLGSTGLGSTGRPGTVARLLGVLIPAVICLVGVAFAGMLVATRPEAEHTEAEERGLPVRVNDVQPRTEAILVHAQGQVVPAQRVVMQPELNGRVTWMNANLVPGGHLSQGDVLVRVDPRDYRAALEAQRAQVENNRLSIAQEDSRRVIAAREWEILRQERAASTQAGQELALREPHQRAATASLRAAESGLRQAQTNLTRTSLQAPFDAIVQAENVDVGQLVGPSSQIATLVGTEHFWVQVSIPLEQLSWIRFPGEGTEGSSASVSQNVGEEGHIVRSGRVIRLLGDLDPVGRMARVLVEIDDPLGLHREPRQPGDASSLPMLLGAFVDVEIEAGVLDGIFEIPREALHAGDVVHLVGGGSRLVIRPIEVVWRREESVLARGLVAGDALVLSQLPSPVEGTQLRRVEPEGEAPRAALPAGAAREGDAERTE